MNRVCRLCEDLVDSRHRYCRRCYAERQNASRDKSRSYLHDELTCLECDQPDCPGICGKVIDACAVRRVREAEVESDG